MSKSSKKSTQSSLKAQITKIFLDIPIKSFNYKQICGKLDVQDKQKRIAVQTMLELLVSEDVLIEKSKGSYQLNPILNEILTPPPSLITGTVDMKQTGKAYIITKELEEDIFIAANNVNRALDGDLVKVHLFPKRSGRKPEGEIIEILERRRTKFVGIVSIGRRIAFLTPDDQRVPMDILILPEDLKGSGSGMKAIAEITEWPEQSNNPFGKIIQVLGLPGDNEVEMKSILASNDFPLSFSQQTLSEVESISEKIEDAEIKKRRDFRNIFTITIDPEDAKDFDDAISLRIIGDSRVEVGVHIADVSHYVKEYSNIDKEAYERGTSIYLVDRVVSMLPERLSNYLCSLQPCEEKLCFSAVFEMDLKGKVYNEWYGKTIIYSDIRFNYEEVQKVIEGAPHPHKNEINTLHTIASSLRLKRFEKGSINFRSKEVKFVLGEDGIPIKAVLKEQKESNHLIEEFMLLANRKVAELVSTIFTKDKKETPPFVYRVHDEPSPERLQNFSNFLQKLGYRLDSGNRKKISNSLNALLDKISGKAEETMIETIAVRTMAKAIYTTENIGHYGLGFSHYTHFTSPIRRYPDLMVHRLLDNYLNKSQNNYDYDELEEACKHCSTMEKKAADAERESVKYKQVEYMAEKLGEKFSGVVSGVSKWGLFVEIDEIMAEGLVKINTLSHDFFYLDEENYCIIGHRTGQSIRLGDRVLVILKSVDLSKKQMELQLENHLSKNKGHKVIPIAHRKEKTQHSSSKFRKETKKDNISDRERRRKNH